MFLGGDWLVALLLNDHFYHSYCLYEDSNEANEASSMVGGLIHGPLDL